MKKNIHCFLLFLLFLSMFSKTNAEPKNNLNCTLIGEWPYGLCEALYATGDTLYMANGRSMQIYDITDIHNPILISEFVTGSLLQVIYIEGSTAYIGSIKEGLLIVDISDLTHPVELSRYPGNDNNFEVQDLHVKNSTVFLIGGRLTALDISIKNEPVFISHIDMKYSQDFCIQGDYCFTSDYNEGTSIYNISDPANMYKQLTIPTDKKDKAVVVKDNYLYIGRSGNAIVYNISDIENPVIVDSMYTGSTIEEMFIHENYISIVANSNGLDIWDISDPHNCEFINYYTTPHNTFYVTATSTRKVIIADNGGDIYLFEFDPEAEMGSLTPAIIEPGGRLQDIEIENNYAYVANSYHGLRIFDISNPAEPQLLSTWRQDLCYATDLVVRNDTVYIATGQLGLQILDTTDKTNPIIIGELDSSYSSNYIQVNKNTVILGDNNKTIHIIDISNPANPVEFNSFKTTGHFDKIHFASPYLVTSESNNGAFLFDLSDDMAPVKLDSIETSSRVTTVTLYEQYLITYDDSDYIIISDITEASSIVNVDSILYRQFIHDMQVVNNILYISNHSEALCIMDLNDIFNPEIIGTYNTSNGSDKLAVSDDLIGFLNKENGLWFVRFNPITEIADDQSAMVPHRIQLKQNYPNPFNPQTTIEYQLDRKQQINLSLYNINGQLVKVLYNGEKTAGHHKTILNAADLPSGVYFFKLETNSYIDTKKCILLK